MGGVECGGRGRVKGGCEEAFEARDAGAEEVDGRAECFELGEGGVPS